MIVTQKPGCVPAAQPGDVSAGLKGGSLFNNNGQHEATGAGLNRYLRKPDARFWLELLGRPPMAGEAAAVRRRRVTRFALGVATVVALLYAVPALFLVPEAFWPGIVVNVLAATSYGLGMWMASLGQPNSPRVILILTLVLHNGLLLWLVGNAVLIVVFAPLIALLGRALIPEHQRLGRTGCYLASLALILAALGPWFPGVLDFSRIPPGLTAFTRWTNPVVAMLAAVALLATFDKEVLRSEAALITERERSDRLLHAVLPHSIAEELRHYPGMIAEHHPAITVLFADIVGFTPWAAERGPGEVIEFLERIFSRFDEQVQTVGAEKIKTIGDAYMAVAGAPEPRSDHARVIAELARALLRELQSIRAETGLDLDVRVGIHSGPVIAGVIGATRFSYDVWGDTVNTASRMESSGEAGRIQVTAATREHLSDHYSFKPRGEVEVKGKGRMPTWWLKT